MHTYQQPAYHKAAHQIRAQRLDAYRKRRDRRRWRTLKRRAWRELSPWYYLLWKLNALAAWRVGVWRP